MNFNYPTLDGVCFYFPSQVAQNSSLESDFLIVGRWQRVDADQGLLEWDGGSVRLSQVHQIEQGGILQGVANTQLQQKPQDGDILLIKARRSSQRLKALKYELLAPNTKNSLQSMKTKAEQLLLQQFAQYKHAVNAFFLEKGFVEIQTPSIVSCPGTEPYLDPIQIEHSSPVFLPTSPEIHLKKALNQGFSKIYEIKSCFRGGESGGHHQLEFQMLEWYRAFGHLGQIQEDLQELLNSLQGKLSVKTDAQIKSFSVKELFAEYCNFNLQPHSDLVELFALAQSLKLHPPADASWDDCFFLIFISLIEPKLKELGQPILVYDYPPQLAAYARVSEFGWAQRFELYWRGLEICNAFQELNDPEIQKARFEQDLLKKASIGKQVVPIDTEFTQALERAFPPAAGIALGLERLFMAVMGLESIEALKVFPYTKIN